jgi:hypothetical protein
LKSHVNPLQVKEKLAVGALFGGGGGGVVVGGLGVVVRVGGFGVLPGGSVCRSVVVVLSVVVVVVLLDAADDGADEAVGEDVDVGSVEYVSDVVIWTESLLLGCGAAVSSLELASAATVANTVATTTAATPSAMYGERESFDLSAGSGNGVSSSSGSDMCSDM